MARYSVVIPCYKSSGTIRSVVEQTIQELEKLGLHDHEFILVNDASPDDGATVSVLRQLTAEFPFVKVLDLAINTGQHNAILTGLRFAEGDIIIGMDDDMQTHPSQLNTLLTALDEGYDMVFGYYSEKKHGFFRNLGSLANHLSARILIGKPNNLRTSSYWVIRRFIRDNIIQYKHSHAYLQGLFLRTTRNIGSIPIQHFNREVGKSGYTFRTLFRLWSNISGFSVVPLKLATYLGYLSSFLGILGGFIILLMKITHPATQMGWPSTMIAILIFSGFTMMAIGLLGEYVGRLFLAENAHPQAVIREKINCDPQDSDY